MAFFRVKAVTINIYAGIAGKPIYTVTLVTPARLHARQTELPAAPRKEETQHKGGSKEGGKLPFGENKLGFLAKEAFSLFCGGAGRRREGGKWWN